MLRGFTEDTGERNTPVICRVCFISVLKRGQIRAFFHSVGAVLLSSEI